MTTYEWITTFLSPVCGLIGWIAGRRIRRNETIKALQTTIDMVVDKNRELYDEILRLRQENDTQRDAGIKRDNELVVLRDENIKFANEINALKLQIEKLQKETK